MGYKSWVLFGVAVLAVVACGAYVVDRWAQFEAHGRDVIEKVYRVPHPPPVATGQPVLVKDISTKIATGPSVVAPAGMQVLRTMHGVHDASLKDATLASALPLGATGQNVLYIAAWQGYAITPIRSAWKSVENRFTVVWMGANMHTDQEEWKAEGFSRDPLPAAHTVYTTAMTVSPSFYHALSPNRYRVIEGVLAPRDISAFVQKRWP